MINLFLIEFEKGTIILHIRSCLGLRGSHEWCLDCHPGFIGYTPPGKLHRTDKWGALPP